MHHRVARRQDRERGDTVRQFERVIEARMHQHAHRSAEVVDVLELSFLDRLDVPVRTPRAGEGAGDGALVVARIGKHGRVEITGVRAVQPGPVEPLDVLDRAGRSEPQPLPWGVPLEVCGERVGDLGEQIGLDLEVADHLLQPADRDDVAQRRAGPVFGDELVGPRRRGVGRIDVA